MLAFPHRVALVDHPPAPSTRRHDEGELLATRRATPWTLVREVWYRFDALAPEVSFERQTWGSLPRPELACVFRSGGYSARLKPSGRGQSANIRRDRPLSEAMARVNALLRKHGVALDGDDIPREVLEAEGMVAKLPPPAPSANEQEAEAQIKEEAQVRAELWHDTMGLDVAQLLAIRAGIADGSLWRLLDRPVAVEDLPPGALPFTRLGGAS